MFVLTFSCYKLYEGENRKVVFYFLAEMSEPNYVTKMKLVESWKILTSIIFIASTSLAFYVPKL